ncbi:MAG: alpha/beta hydrolase [Chloroflexaceae bacterium]|nr:alpha/beta hydrolase [Chloroflexaceae bacterium]
MRDSLLKCRNRLGREDVNLRAYNSAANAADVEDLRRALGYAQINLYGISYGTRLALTVMRDYPEGLRSVVLDSTYPPNVDLYAEMPSNTVRAFNQIFVGCAANAVCSANYPNLETDFYRLIADLNEDPLVLSFSEFGGGVRISGDDLIGIFFLSLYDTELIPMLPLVIDSTAKQNYEPLQILMLWSLLRGFQADTMQPFDVDGFSEGMYYSVLCREEMPFTTEDAVEAAAAARPEVEKYFVEGFDLDMIMCRIWKAGESGAIENQAVVSDVPTLVLAGDYDPITPPQWGQIAAETLSNGYYYEFPGFGHGVSVSGACPEGITRAFIANPSQAPDTSCMAGLTGANFQTEWRFDFWEQFGQ